MRGVGMAFLAARLAQAISGRARGLASGHSLSRGEGQMAFIFSRWAFLTAF